MAAIVVRNIPDEVKARLRTRATRHGRSMEAEVRAILTETLTEGDNCQPQAGMGAQIAALFKDVGFEDGEFVRPDGGFSPPRFDL